MSSLRVRLLATIGLLVLGSIGSVAFLSARSGRRQFRRFQSMVVVVRTDDSERTTRTVAPVPEPAREAAFAEELDRGLILATTGCGVIAMLLAFVLSRRIFGPVEALTQAARAMALGNRDTRVAIGRNDELGELGRAFNAMAEAVAHGEELRRRLVGDVAHELRTPLTNIRGQLEAIQDGLSVASAPSIDSLHEETMLLATLVDELHEMAASDSGDVRIVTSAVALGEVAAATAMAFESSARGSGVTIRVDMPADLPPIAADPGRVAQILRNLVANALAHTPDGGSIVLGGRPLGRFAEVFVRDSGAGIAERDLPHVWERFYRADLSRSRRTGGAGLGLAIVKRLVVAQGGDVRIESQPGSGATIFFTVPFIENS
ncbi:MAG: ATP-binding protein [Thermoanaerobaculia bacterium]